MSTHPVYAWRQCVWCGKRFIDDDRSVQTCSPDCDKRRRETKFRRAESGVDLSEEEPPLELIPRCSRCGLVDCHVVHRDRTVDRTVLRNPLVGLADLRDLWPFKLTRNHGSRP